MFGLWLESSLEIRLLQGKTGGRETDSWCPGEKGWWCELESVYRREGVWEVGDDTRLLAAALECMGVQGA